MVHSLELLHAESNVQFVSSSPHASPLEILQAVKEDIKSTLAKPVTAFDCETQEEVLIQLYALFFPADNPMRAEGCDGQPLNASNNFRTCDVGGPDEYKRSEEGSATLFKASI
ncbi:hypothetical protein FRC08_004513 [Ceratobasidium sp. 394]|nr:hypothetical protein FRC08_004513 [Ceratobasidium sp. 394]KAG9083084.1 hypothetical protein FS749_006312 [Ceratobasidium sp. UAMH 11750]